MRMREILLCLALVLLAHCAAPGDVGSSEEPLVAGATLTQAARGRDLFNHEGFMGNGRKCSTCHTTVERTIEIGHLLGLGPLQQLAFSAQWATFELDPEFVQIVWSVNPSDPLFADIDRDPDGTFTTLRERALIRVSFDLPPNIHAAPLDARAEANITTLGDGTQRITVLRSVPNVTNLAEDDSCKMWDCRVQGKSATTLTTLTRQARGTDGLHGALGDHFQPGRAMTANEGRDIAAFQAQLFTRLDLFVHANNGTQPSLPACDPNVPASCRGREFFVSQPALASDMAHRGLCAMCHSGPGLNRTNEFNPVQPPAMPLSDGTCPCITGGLPMGPAISYFTSHANADGTCPDNALPTIPGTTVAGMPACFHRLANNVVAERNIPDLPEYLFTGIDPTYGPIEFPSPDLGHIFTSGRLCEFAAACFLSPFSLSFTPRPGTLGTQSVFRIQSLWGVSNRRRLNHDNGPIGEDAIARDLVHLQDFNIFFHISSSNINYTTFSLFG